MSGAEGIGGGAASYFAALSQAPRSAPASNASASQGAASMSGGEGGGPSVSPPGVGEGFDANG